MVEFRARIPCAADVGDRIRQATEKLCQELIDAEAAAVIGAGPWERSEHRSAQRNGTRARTLTTTAGDLELRIPKLRSGSFFPSLLERRRRVDQALFAVIMEAYLHGVSTRKVDDLVKALGADSGISKSEVSRICADLDEEVGAFRDRPLADQAFPYVSLDATYCKARVNRRVVSQAVVIATAVSADGRGEVLGFDVGDSEDGAFWTAFLRSLKARGLTGVQLVISDAHEGLKAAIASVLIGASWQRCRVHFMRNVLAKVPKGHGEMALAAIRTVFAQPDAEHVHEQFDSIATISSIRLLQSSAAHPKTPQFSILLSRRAHPRDDLWGRRSGCERPCSSRPARPPRRHRPPNPTARVVGSVTGKLVDAMLASTFHCPSRGSGWEGPNTFTVRSVSATVNCCSTPTR